MSARLSEYYSYIECLATAPRQQRVALLETATKDQLKIICEIIHNVLQEHVTLPDSNRQRIAPYANIFERIGRLECSSEGLRRLLLRHHGVHLKYLLGGAFLDKLGLIVERWRERHERREQAQRAEPPPRLS